MTPYEVHCLSTPLVAGILSGIVAGRLKTTRRRVAFSMLLPIPMMVLGTRIYTWFAIRADGFRDAHVPIELFIMPLVAWPLALVTGHCVSRYRRTAASSTRDR